MSAQFGMIGLGVMGENLALNVEDHGFSVAVWNLEGEWVDRFVSKNQGRKITGGLRHHVTTARTAFTQPLPDKRPPTSLRPRKRTNRGPEISQKLPSGHAVTTTPGHE